MALGNPAPFGLISFGMTTFMLMWIEMGWVEDSFEIEVAGTAIALGGIGQLLAAIFELIRGASFPFAVFGSYGAFWIGWAISLIEQSRSTSTFEGMEYVHGSTFWLAQWGVLTALFFPVTMRKNICLMIILGFLAVTFWLLAIANALDSDGVRKAGGVFGMVTAATAVYTAIAELINEEWGSPVLPGLKPLHNPARQALTVDSVGKLISYDKKSNTIFLSFRGLHIKSREHVDAMAQAVEAAILTASPKEQKVHVVADYEGTYISDDVADYYKEVATNTEREHYLSATRFHSTTFGSGKKVGPAGPAGNLDDKMSKNV